MVVLNHPLVQHRLRWLRDRSTDAAAFGRLVGELSGFVAYEAFRSAPLTATTVDTPLVDHAAASVVDDDYLVVPILRAGLAMAPAVQAVLASSRLGLVGLRRDERTLAPSLYLDGLPARLDGTHVVVCDPMLATGGSLCLVADLLAERGAREVTVLCLIAAVPGVERFSGLHPTAKVVTAALDAALDDRGFIVPGLGDAGDRLFGPAPT